MGLRLTVAPRNNALYHEFVDAYWKIENIVFSNMNGRPYVSFSLLTYPSREASQMTLEPIVQDLTVGGTDSIAYNPVIRRWEATFETTDIFEDAIPLDEASQKARLYRFVKAYTGLPFEDVLEA